MKHFTLLMAAMMAATSAFAAIPQKGSLGNVNAAKHMPAKHVNKANGIKAPRTVDLNKLKQGTPVLSRAESGVITEAEGTTQTYWVYSEGFEVFFGYVFFEPATSLKEVVWGDNGDVYIKNFLDLGLDDYYIKGKLADGKVTVEFPQPVYNETIEYDEDEDGEPDFVETYAFNLNVLKYTEYYDEEDDEVYQSYFNVEDPALEKVEFAVNEDGTLSMLLNPGYGIDTADGFPEYIIGLVEDTTPGMDDWYGFGDAVQEYSIFDRVAIEELPEGVTSEEWAMSYTSDTERIRNQFVQVAVDGNTMYIGDLHEDTPGWIKGTIADGKVYFENDQYIGYSKLYASPYFFLTGTYTQEYDPDWDEDLILIELSDGIYMDYDAEAKTLKLTDANTCIVLNDAPELGEWYLAFFTGVEIKFQTPEMLCAAPLDPEVLDYIPWSEDLYGGQGAIAWNIPAVNVKGALLNTADMYYNFIVDGEIYPLNPDEYPEVLEYMEDIPYDYTDDWDIAVADEEHDIYFYFQGAESFGLQSFYKAPDGNIYASNLVTFVPEEEDPELPDDPSGINDVKYIKVESTKYVDMLGREVANPANGMYIKQMKLADGTTRTAKVIVK